MNNDVFVNRNYSTYFMISETGKNLHVLILTEPDKNWQTFATWYSIYKNWPDALTIIVSNRNGEMPFESFQWAKRLNIPLIHRNPFVEETECLDLLAAIKMAQDRNYLGDFILVIRPLMMAIDVLDSNFLKCLNESKSWNDRGVWYLNKCNLDSLIEDFYLGDWNGPENINPLWVEANQSKQLCCLTSCKKGCGRWIDTSKGCPFSSANGLISDDMTVNELRINDLWRKMVPLFNSVV